MSRATNPIVIYQANEAVALNGSYIETGTYNGEVIYGCDESTIRNAAKKYAEPVSYTHLDVYKRQVLNTAILWNEDCGFLYPKFGRSEVDGRFSH